MDRNIAQAMKRKRDAEERLRLTSSAPVFVGGGDGGGTYITNEQIINNIEYTTQEITTINQTINNINNLITQKDLLTNGDPASPSLLFSPQGDVIWVEV